MLPVIILIFGTMLLTMLTRVFLPIGTKTEGTSIVSLKLPFRYRLLYHRTSIYLVGTAMVLGAVGGWLSFPLEVIVILAAFAIVSAKIRYTFTVQGVALNNVVFRQWSEFKDFQLDNRYLRLIAKEGLHDFKILLPVKAQDEVMPLVTKLVKSKGAAETMAVTASLKNVTNRSGARLASPAFKASRPAKKRS